MPFFLTRDGVRCEEIAPHEEHDESWRALKVTFPSGIHVHCPEQKFYFNDAGHLIRNDYAPEVTQGAAAHYTFDHNTCDDFILLTLALLDPLGTPILACSPRISRLSGPRCTM